MQLIEHTGAIEDYPSDALVYSTNQQLILSGGVGAALVKKYGNAIQEHLSKQLNSYPTGLVPVGTVFDCAIDGLPYKRIFHSIATDLDYETEKATVSKIIRYCLHECDIDFAIASVVFSALGSGYGSLTYAEFIRLLKQELEDYVDSDLIVVVAQQTPPPT
tara:strand:+ start:461 stop:943 length:483 start_codon:yes stop_codon:yes gene_type:complete